MRPDKSPKGAKVSRKGFSEAELAEYARGASDLPLEVHFQSFRQPEAKVRASVANVQALDGADTRLGLRYLRMPYFFRDFEHALYNFLWKLFGSVETGSDVNYLERHPELKLIGFGGMTESNCTPERVAKAHVNLFMHHYYRVHHMILKYVAVMNMAKKANGVGYITKGSSPTWKFAVLNNMISQIADLPINREYLDGCASYMVELIKKDPKTGYLVVCPDWLPLGQTYYSQARAYGDVTTHATPWNSRTMVHPMVGDYAVDSYYHASCGAESEGRVRGFNLTAKPSEYTGRFSSVAALSKGQGYFFDHVLEQLMAEVDLYFDCFLHNAVSSQNVGVVGNKVMNFWASLGLMNERVTFVDVAKLADDVATDDLTTFAKANFRFNAEIGPVARFNADLTLLQDLGSYEDEFFNLSTHDYVMGHTDTALHSMREYPYLGLSASDTYDIETFLDGRGAEVVGLRDGGVEGSGFDMVSKELSVKELVTRRIKSYLTTEARFTDGAHVGDYLRGLQDPNVVAYNSLTRAGRFLPAWEVTPVIDPNDPYANGIFILIDLRNSAPRESSWENLFKQVTSLASHASGLTAAAIDSSGRYKYTGLVATDNIFYKFADNLGAVPLFIGDAAELPAPLHLLRADIGYLSFGATEDIKSNRNFLPAVPYRPIPVDITLMPALAVGTFAPASSSITGSFTARKDGVIITALDADMTGVLKSIDMDDSPCAILSPIFTPSMRRMMCEFTDNGMYAHFASKFNYDVLPKFTCQRRASRKAVALPKGLDPNADRKALRDEERGRGPQMRKPRSDYRSAPRAAAPSTPVAPVVTDPRAQAHESA